MQRQGGQASKYNTVWNDSVIFNCHYFTQGEKVMKVLPLTHSQGLIFFLNSAAPAARRLGLPSGTPYPDTKIKPMNFFSSGHHG